MRKRNKSNLKHILLQATAATSLLMFAGYVPTTTRAGEVGVTPLLEGIGFYEMVDQNGVNGVSLAGGAEIVVYGQGMSHTPSTIQAIFTNKNLGLGQGQGGPPRPQDLAFNSHTGGGKLKYTTSSLMEIHNKPREVFDSFEWLTYELSLVDYNSMTQQVKNLACSGMYPASNCYITYSRAFTPILYGITPPVVFSDSEISFWMDVRSAQNKKSQTLPEFPFVEVRLNGYGVDFEGFLEDDTVLPIYTKVNVRGKMGAIAPNASADAFVRFRVGYAMHMDYSMIRCSYDNSTCYKAKAVGRIDSIDNTQGYSSGGQILTVKGYGFQSENIAAKVDGIDCKVLEKSDLYFKCKTGAQPLPSTGSSFVGQHGLRRRFFNSSYQLNSGNLAQSVEYKDMIAVDLEAPYGVKDGYSGNIFSGYFKAPATAGFRFYISCDDWCQLSFSSVDKNPAANTTIYTSDGYTGFRGYLTGNGGKRTQWFNLTKDNYYYIELKHIQHFGADHASVAVEIDDPSITPGHHHTMKEIQRFVITQNLTRDTTNITIQSPDGGEFTLTFVDPKTLANTVSGKLSTNMSAGDFNNAVKAYYTNVFNAWISVSKTMYSEDGNVTTNAMNASTIVFSIQVQRSLSIASTNKITVQRLSTMSPITISLPMDTQLSNPPLTGLFRIKCALDKTGTVWNTTQPINQTTTWWGNIRDIIIQSCPIYRDNFEVSNGPTQSYSDDNRDFMIRFVGLNYDLPQFEIINDPVNSLQGVNVQLNQSTWLPYDPSKLFYEPVPFDFLYTVESTPQVIVTVDGVEAVCASLNCNYNYVAPIAQITSFSYSGTTLTITGTDIPSTVNSVKFSNIDCLSITVTAPTTITCQVTAVAGSWAPIVTDPSGIIPIASSASNINVNIGVASLTPSSSLNPYGGAILTLTGSAFPQSLTEGNIISLIFSDGSKCEIVSISSTLIRCLTSGFNTASSSTPSLTVNINGKTDNSKSVSVSTAPTKVTLLTPNSVSPVLKNLLSINVTGFPNTMTKDDLEVSVVSTNLAVPITRKINVVEVGTTSTGHYIKAKFGGSESAIYQLIVRSRAYGNFDTTGITLTTIGKVTDYNPKSGSIHGGTLITIDGYHFSDDYQDNPIRIGYTDCLVESTSRTQIKCRTEPRIQETTGVEDFIVLLKTYEEAICGFGVGMCTYTWTDTATVTSYSVAFEPTENHYVLTVSGTGFAATTSNTEVLIDNIKQEIISASDTLIKVRIVDMMKSTSLDTDIQLPVGHPGGTDDLNYATGITLIPRIHAVSPNVGSLGGALIIAEVRGFGNMTADVTLVNSAGNDICATVTVTKYGELKCLTKENLAVADGPLSLKVGTTVYSCTGSTANSCNYQTSSTLVTVSAISKTSDTTISITGAGFSAYTASSSPFFKFASIKADSVSVASDTSATATFTNGVPLTSGITGVKGQLYFQENSTPKQQWAYFESTATLINTVSVTSIDSAVTCSFAGGCAVSISQPGLLSSLIGDPTKNQVRVCGQLCTPNVADSTGTVTKCSLPALPTQYSIDNFKIVGEQYLMGIPFSSNSALTMTVWDGSHQNGWTSTSRNCSFGTAFRAGYIGQLNEVKYFMGRFNKAKFVGFLKFQGSSDGLNFVDIFTVGQEIHEGWNYYNYPAGSELKYRYYRFYGSGDQSCMVGEVSLRGYEVIDSATSSFTCQASLVINGATQTPLTNSITYQNTLTPLLTSISPRFGSVVGGEIVTFNGAGFSTNVADYNVAIDGRVCTVQTASATSFTCLTDKRPGLYPNPKLDIRIAGMGSVATQGLTFRYVNYWSEPLTWGGEFAPIEGDMVYVPKGLNLLVDVDSTPVLSAVVVEGGLIFPSNPNPNHLRTFDAHYVMVKGGLFEAGTEQFPYTSKLLITMHSNRSSPELPIFGNKVIAMYNGVLDMHGVPRNPTWTELDVTAQIGSTTIKMIRDVDWQVGEQIVIAPTGYFNFEAEERTIIAVDRTNPSKPVLTLDKPLEFQHFAEIQTFGANNQDFIEMRAEVGLLSRNVMFRGDPETSAQNEYGAQIMVHSNGMETLTARIEYVHFFNVGQAFQLGRYPIHFHLIGVVHNSYIKGNTIQQSFNRACTIHGVHYLRIIENVAFNVKGHNFFIEDAAETKNYLEKNLAIWTKKSWSLLNSDQSPASFWITNPDNIFRGNHAAGSDNYGFWFDTKPNPTGPSFDPNICPENNPLGEFTNNVAHSNGRYGLRVFHKLKPRTYPCMDLIYDSTRPSDPYWQNPPIAAVFQNFTSFKNRRNGAIALDIGQVRFENFKVSDNILAGIEVELSDTMVDGYAMVNGALVIGHSNNADYLTNAAPSHGIIGPRTEGFQVHNVKFYNFDIAGKAALGSCSHCFSLPSTDSGGRTVTFSNLSFDSSTTIKIRYQEPWREIFYDLDGSLTGLGPKTWTTSYWRHNLHPECTVNMQVYDGLLCNNQVEVRRLVFYKYTPDSLNMMEMKVLQFDDSIVAGMNATTKAAYRENITNYSVAPWRPKANPLKSWALPFVTGKKYRIHWQKGVDFTKMQIDLSPHWKPTDKDVYFIHNFTDVRAKIDFLTGGDKILNETILSTNNAPKQTGVNIVYNDTATREIHYMINGKNASRKSINMVCYRCVGPCIPAVNNVAIETNIRYWSKPESWTSKKVPLENEDVVVEPGWNMIYDLEESPIYRYVQINGRVTFKTDAPKLHLRAKYLYVRMGELLIGSEGSPFAGQATITLYGMKRDEHIIYENAIEAGNKILANTALISMWGQQRSPRTRLLKTVMPNDQSITVETGLDWKINDTVALPSTTMNWFELDTATIISYNNDTGVVTLDKKLSYYHWGALTSTGPQYNGVDMRGEVMLLSRNIKIRGNDTDAWGCQVVTSDFVEGNLEQRIGRTYMDNVEIYNCSQYDTWKAAIRFEGAVLGYSRISNSAIHHGLGIAGHITNSENVELVNNNVYTFSRYGLVIQTSKNITFDGNWVSGIHNRGLSAKGFGDTQGAIVACGHVPGDKCEEISIINNIVSSLSPSAVDSAGFSVPGHQCGNYNTAIFRDNIAHSINGYGAIIYRNMHVGMYRNCIEASRFVAYKCVMIGIVSNQAVDNVAFTDMTLIDNGFSASANVGLEGEFQTAKLKNIKFYGETDARECKKEGVCINGQDRGCYEKNAIMPSTYANHNKQPLVSSTSACPQFKPKGDASFGGVTTYENIQFINFKSGKTYCGEDQRLIRLNRFNADYLPAVKFIGTRFENVAQETLAYLFTPPNEWAVLDDCGQFPCTGPLNTLLKFERSTFAGQIRPLRTDSNFQIIASNDENSGNFPTCKKVTDWNGYYCTNENFAILTWESLDEDKLTRIITPIEVIGMNLTTRNVINTFMDHMWDGFYTSMKRLSRWVSIIQGGNGMMYELIYKSTPPLRQRFNLKSDEVPVVIRIKYPKAGVYIVKDLNGKEIVANPWDNNIKQPMQIRGFRGGYCGENRYIGVVNILEFYLNKGCSILIEPIDSIQASVRMNWTMNQFFADGGTTKFVDRVAASLGLRPANIKVVSVYQGSVIVDFTIIEDLVKSVLKAGGMDQVQNALTQALTSKTINLGAPIMNAMVQVNKVASTAPAAQTYASTTTQVIQTSPTGQPVIVKDTNAANAQFPTIPAAKPLVVQTVYNTTTISVVQTQMESAGSGSNSTMIAIIGSIVAVIVVGAIIGALIYKRYQARVAEISDKIQAKQIDQSSKIDNSQMSRPEIASAMADDEKYEEQYHPRVAAVDIFGNGDIIKKANEADAVYVDNVDDSDESDDQQSSNAESGAPQATQANHHTQNNFLTNGNSERGASPVGRDAIIHMNNVVGNQSPDALTIKRVRASKDLESTPGTGAFQTNHKILGGHLGVPK